MKKPPEQDEMGQGRDDWRQKQDEIGAGRTEIRHRQGDVKQKPDGKTQAHNELTAGQPLGYFGMESAYFIKYIFF